MGFRIFCVWLADFYFLFLFLFLFLPRGPWSDFYILMKDKKLYAGENMLHTYIKGTWYRGHRNQTSTHSTTKKITPLSFHKTGFVVILRKFG